MRITGIMRHRELPQVQLISAPGRRFPRAWLQPPRRFAPARSSAHAIPAGVAAFHFNQQNVLAN